jgi:hypothetical protein
LAILFRPVAFYFSQNFKLFGFPIFQYPIGKLDDILTSILYIYIYPTICGCFPLFVIKKIVDSCAKELPLIHMYLTSNLIVRIGCTNTHTHFCNIIVIKHQPEQATFQWDNDGDVSYISQNKQHFNEIMMVMSAISARTSSISMR